MYMCVCIYIYIYIHTHIWHMVRMPENNKLELDWNSQLLSLSSLSVQKYQELPLKRMRDRFSPGGTISSGLIFATFLP